ncbi:hypothetical protein [Thalassotalea agariperforans]
MINQEEAMIVDECKNQNFDADDFNHNNLASFGEPVMDRKSASLHAYKKAIARAKIERRLEKRKMRELTDTLYGDWD